MATQLRRPRPDPVMYQGHKFSFIYWQGNVVENYRCSKRISCSCFATLKHDTRTGQKFVTGVHSDECIAATPRLVLPRGTTPPGPPNVSAPSNASNSAIAIMANNANAAGSYQDNNSGIVANNANVAESHQDNNSGAPTFPGAPIASTASNSAAAIMANARSPVEVSSGAETQIAVEVPVINGFYDCRKWIENKVGVMSFLQEHGRPLTATEVATRILAQCDLEFPFPKRAYTLQQIIRCIYQERKRNAGDAATMISLLDLPEYRYTAGESPQIFVHGSVSRPFKHKKKNQDEHHLDRVILFSHPALHCFLKADGVFMLVDATFKCVPRRPYFYQMLNVMIYIKGLDLYVPAAWILMTGKSQVLYEYAFQLLIDMCDRKLNPSFISVDFEQALINALKKKFCAPHGHAVLLGCFFHFKQAIRRRMQQFHFSDAAMKKAMEPGMLDLFRIINPEDKFLAQDYLMEELDCLGEESEKWTRFWNYFETTWFDTIDLYNVYKKITPGTYQVYQETNNVCERYNLHVQEKLGVHPDLMTFLGILKSEAEHWLRKMEQTRNGVRDATDRRAQAHHKLPARYLNWLANDPNIRFPTNNPLVNYGASLREGQYNDPTQPVNVSDPVSGEDLCRLFADYDDAAVATVAPGTDIGAPMPPLPTISEAASVRPASAFSPGREPANKRRNQSSTPQRRNTGGTRNLAQTSLPSSSGSSSRPYPNPYLRRSKRVPTPNKKYL